MLETSSNSYNQAVITNLSHDGRGIVSINGKKTFIDGVFNGETVIFKYTKKHRRYNEAKVETIIKADPNRVEPICPNYLACGGCSYQHMSNIMQLEHKQNILKELLIHFGNKVQPKVWLAPLQADTQHYRTKARLGVKYVIKKEKLLVGFREKSSNFILDMNTCKVLTKELDNLIIPINNLISSLSIYNQIPQVELAMGNTQGNKLEDNKLSNKNNIAIIIRNLAEFTQDDLIKLKNFADNYKIFLYLQPGNNNSVYRIDSEELLNNKLNILEYYFNYNKNNINFKINYNFHPQDFTQVNLQLNSLMLTQALDLLDLQGNETVLDLFCGLGNFSLPIAKYLSYKSGKVIGIEGCSDMVARAINNAKNNNINNVEFYCADLYSKNIKNITNNILKDTWLNYQYDCIVLDPPRSGAKEVLEYIGRSNAKKILYISCDPATFARDVGILSAEYDYQLEYCGIMDMFPHTKHVETMGLLVKK